MKKFMFKHTREKDLLLFHELYQDGKTANRMRIFRLRSLVPAYAISELKTAFQMGFMIFIPFLVIDMVVASTLDGDGDDDASAGHDFAAVQNIALCAGRWLVSGSEIAAAKF